ncbi:putative RTA1 domain protein [Mollisia scopiformis]|uniref:Putative RTA1 domain protein n=1 Tax=Mollisia scopiformis TaxID=149040 RepID=A0A132B616_MOLSC|nr:putative RTA1 domain protein [Mollisia scopiformis]KUJ07855.1 putative RTA1 domain protein [Mollisia scopiformis]
MTKSHYDLCTSVTPECPVNETLYGYYPNLGANAFFAALFAFLLIAQLIIGTWTKTWTFMLAVGLGVFGEMAGYIGRLIMHQNPWSNAGFEAQICCLVLAPSFLAAGIYLTLKHMVIYCGPEYSHLKAKWYPWIFIGSDLGSIIVQAIGGGVAASAKNSTNKSLLSAGDALIIAGIALQSVTMSVCGLLVLDFFLARRKARTEHKAELEGTASLDATTLPNDVHTKSPLRFRIFCCAIGFAFFTILVRCIYRIPEMAGGWGNPRMRDEPVFLGLDGAMVAMASIAFTVAHPGFMFPPMRKGRRNPA